MLKDGVGFGRRARRAEPGLSQYRAVQRGVAAAFQPVRRRQADHADHDRRRAEEFGLLAGDRGADARHGAVLPQGRRARTGWRTRLAATKYLTDGRRRRSSAARPCSPRPARAAIRARRPSRRRQARSAAAAPGRTIWTAGTRYWAWTKTDEYKSADARRSSQRPISSTAIFCRPSARMPVTLLQHQRLQPAGDQRDRAATSGTISPRRPTRTCRRSGRSRVHDPFTGEAQPIQDAGRRARLHAPAVADQPVVDGAVPAEQHGRARSIRTLRSTAGCGSFDASIEQMLWPEKRSKDPVLGDKVPGIIDRTTARSYV